MLGKGGLTLPPCAASLTGNPPLGCLKPQKGKKTGRIRARVFKYTGGGYFFSLRETAQEESVNPECSPHPPPTVLCGQRNQSQIPNSAILTAQLQCPFHGQQKTVFGNEIYRKKRDYEEVCYIASGSTFVLLTVERQTEIP